MALTTSPTAANRSDATTPPARPARSEAAAAQRLLRSHDLATALLGGLAVAAVWQFSRQGWYAPGSDAGYWMGVVGGVLMLLLFAYPLRKRWPALAGLGKAKYWFIGHMLLGSAGPLLVLAHSNFQVGSLNAGVALYSMLVVAASGVVGRFIYLRIHRGLGGERLNREQLRAALGLDADAVQRVFAHAPAVEARLRALDRHAGRPQDAWGEHLHHLFVLPWTLWRVRQRCRRLSDHALRALSRQEGWGPAQRRACQQQARRLLGQYTLAVLRSAQLAAYTRLFSLWHVLHLPFVVLMVLCAVIHVIAVHAY